MALRDISFYKYIEAAFRHKLFKDKTATFFNFLGYNLPYETTGGTKGIFEYARKVLPSAYTGKFADTKEGNLQMAKAVIDKLDKEKKELEVYVDPAAVREYEFIVADAQAQSGQAAPGGQEAPLPSGEPAGTMAGGIPFPGIAAGGATAATAPRRVIHVVQQARGGKEGGTGTGTAATNKAAGLAAKQEVPSTPVDNVSKETTQPARGIKGSTRFQRPRFKIPAGIRSLGSTIGSKTGIFLNRNIIPIARTGLGAFAGGVLTGGNPLGMLGGGIGGATFNAWGRKALNGTINAGVSISNQVSRGSFVKGGSKKIVFLFLGGFLLLAFGTAFLGALAPGGGAPGTGNVGVGTTAPPGPVGIGSTAPPGSTGAVTCPLDGRRTIGCGSFMSDPIFNRIACAGPRPIDRGHCGLSYSCKDSRGVQITDPNIISNMRRAHAIDVDAAPGEQVKLPFIQGQNLEWTYSGRYGPLSRVDGGGYGHFFTANLGGDVWIVHFVHTSENRILPPTGRFTYQSGDPAVTIADTDYDHVHVNIGKNATGADGGSGWLDPESLGMCVN